MMCATISSAEPVLSIPNINLIPHRLCAEPEQS
jgi:hypothetical protein